MAGDIRQTINAAALSTYLDKNVPGIKLPIGLKQVLLSQYPGGRAFTDTCLSLPSVNRILPTSSVLPMEGNTYYEKSRQASYSPRLHTRSNASSASSTPYKAQMYPFPKLTGCARTRL